METRVWFCRHGEVEAHHVGALIGTTEARLSPLGRHQAEAIKEFLHEAPIDAIVASPRMRSRETVAPLAHEKGLKIDVRAGLAEMDFGAWEAMHWPAILERHGDEARTWEADPHANRPGRTGESAAMFHERVSGTFERLLEEFRGRTVLVAGHAGTNRSILASVLGRPYLDCFVFAQDYGCVNAVSHRTGLAQVALLNFVPGPRAGHQGE